MLELENMSMLIMSCDKFSDLWDGHVKLLEENWHERGIKTAIVTDAQSDKSYPNVEIISVGTRKEWSERLEFALKLLETEYVFITLDDYFLIDKVDNKSISDLVDIMKNENYDYIRLFPRPKRATGKGLKNHKKVFDVDISCDYSVNLYSGIWKKAFLRSTIREPKNAWQFEVSLPQCAREYGAKCLVSNRKDFKILDVVRKGKLLHKAVRYFKKHPGIYEGKREINTWKYEIRLTVQQQISRHLPVRIKKWLKKMLKKRGFQFYTE